VIEVVFIGFVTAISIAGANYKEVKSRSAES
jgi:hypothetical protein